MRRRLHAREVAAVREHQGPLPNLHTPLFSQSPSSIPAPTSPHHLNLPGLFFSSSFPEGLPVSSPASLQSPTAQSRRLERRDPPEPVPSASPAPWEGGRPRVTSFLYQVLDSFEFPGQNRPLMSQNSVQEGAPCEPGMRAACLRLPWWSCPLAL